MLKIFLLVTGRKKLILGHFTNLKVTMILALVSIKIIAFRNVSSKTTPILWANRIFSEKFIDR